VNHPDKPPQRQPAAARRTGPAAALASSTTLALLALLNLPLAAQAQGATIYGALSNFDAANNEGRDANGFEIELDGIQAADISGYWTGNKYGQPQLSATATGVLVRYLAGYDAAAGQWSGRTVPFTPTVFRNCYPGQASYLSSGCDHFGVHFVNYLKQPTATTYRWLLADAAQPGRLAAAGSTVLIPAPVWSVLPATATQPAQIVATVQLPPAPPTPAPLPQYGTASWIKVSKTELPRAVTLDELRTGNTAVSPEDPTQVETAWKLVQASPPGSSRQRGKHVNQATPNGNSKAVVRRYESYAFTGSYDALTHEAVCADGSCSAPAAGEVGGILGAQIAAANIAVPSVSVTLAGNGSGKVGGSGVASRINCGGSCSVPTALGAATLTASASSGSVFAGWSGACTGTAPSCVLDVNAALAATASFNTAAAGGGGGGGSGGGGSGGGGKSKP